MVAFATTNLGCLDMLILGAMLIVCITGYNTIVSYNKLWKFLEKISPPSKQKKGIKFLITFF
jgi:hypothetical protein